MNQDHSATWATGLGIFLLLIGLVFALALYLFYCYCLKLICQKTGRDPGALIWLPIVHLLPLLEVAKMPLWVIILFLIPPVNIVVGIIMWVKICEARGKSGWLVILMFVPVANLFFIPYLAFSE